MSEQTANQKRMPVLPRLAEERTQVQVRGMRPLLAEAQQGLELAEVWALRRGLDDGTLHLLSGEAQLRMA